MTYQFLAQFYPHSFFLFCKFFLNYVRKKVSVKKVKMATIIPDFPGAHPLTRKPEHPGYEICVIYVSLFYLLHIENTGFVSSTGKQRLASVIIKSERQTKEKRSQRKNLAETKI